MANQNGIFDRVRIVYTNSPILLKCAVLVTIVVCVGALTVLRIGIDQYQDGYNALRAQAAQVEYENDQLRQMTAEKDTVDGVAAIAAEKLDMVDGDTVFYDVIVKED